MFPRRAWSVTAWSATIALAGAIVTSCGRDASRPAATRETAAAPAASGAPPPVVQMPYADATPALDKYADALPPELARLSPADREAAWAGWATGRDTAIRARLRRGDEDSIVNLWRYGTTFTSRPRATDQVLAQMTRDEIEHLLIGRLDDLVAALAAPEAPERVRFARQVVERQGIDPRTPQGQDQARAFLVNVRERVIAETAQYRRDAEAAVRAGGGRADERSFASLYRDRGLSSDTSLPADFAIDQAIAAIASTGVIAKQAVTRVAVVGPGLDFTDKAEGYDFYPVQTIQPFAVVDSLLRFELASVPSLRLSTLDLSPRVNQHLDAARQRAARGESYVIQLPLAPDDTARQWHPELARYWQRSGDRIGDVVPAAPAPLGASGVRVRAIRVRPEVVQTITPSDVDIVLERLRLDGAGAAFDLAIATNVLSYYGGFEQALALANIAAMLKPGGVLLTNIRVTPVSGLEPAPAGSVTVYWDRGRIQFDTMYWYRKS